MSRSLFALLALGVACCAWAQEDASNGIASVGLERSRIDAQRSQALAAFVVEEQDCLRRFAVSACVRDIASRRNALLAELKRQEASLNDAERLKRGADQVKRAEEKSAERVLVEQDAAASSPSAQLEKKAAQGAKLREHQKRKSESGTQARESKNEGGLTEAEINENRLAYARKIDAANKRKLEREKRLGEPAIGALPTPP
ncbi:MAG: hypothetical protein RLZZ573_1020 [Pseudomonadota bacterium]|jgi:hypothetical protein